MNRSGSGLRPIVADALRVLTFRRPSPAIATHWPGYLAFGLACTWLAGIGRYWDSPRAAWWQHLGLGSLAYVVVLAAILWLLLMPLRPARWSYRNVLVFVTLTAPPALLYAIPVERFMTLATAQATNAVFLGIVALWRVALLAWFLARMAGLRAHAILVATLLPITLIVVALAMLNLEHVVFNIMAGIRPEDRSPNDLAYLVVVNIAFWSVLLAPILVLAYLVMAFNARSAGRRRERDREDRG
ncbi:MAG: hypothetical protein J0L88_06705 [Xanthomonadales bacterium]|nr:hypothetical protein [Xanthomonadales bacterium]